MSSAAWEAHLKHLAAAFQKIHRSSEQITPREIETIGGYLSRAARELEHLKHGHTKRTSDPEYAVRSAVNAAENALLAVKQRESNERKFTQAALLTTGVVVPSFCITSLTWGSVFLSGAAAATFDYIRQLSASDKSEIAPVLANPQAIIPHKIDPMSTIAEGVAGMVGIVTTVKSLARLGLGMHMGGNAVAAGLGGVSAGALAETIKVATDDINDTPHRATGRILTETVLRGGFAAAFGGIFGGLLKKLSSLGRASTPPQTPLPAPFSRAGSRDTGHPGRVWRRSAGKPPRGPHDGRDRPTPLSLVSKVPNALSGRGPILYEKLDEEGQRAWVTLGLDPTQPQTAEAIQAAWDQLPAYTAARNLLMTRIPSAAAGQAAPTAVVPGTIYYANLDAEAQRAWRRFGWDETLPQTFATIRAAFERNPGFVSERNLLVAQLGVKPAPAHPSPAQDMTPIPEDTFTGPALPPAPRAQGVDRDSGFGIEAGLPRRGEELPTTGPQPLFVVDRALFKDAGIDPKTISNLPSLRRAVEQKMDELGGIDALSSTDPRVLAVTLIIRKYGLNIAPPRR